MDWVSPSPSPFPSSSMVTLADRVPAADGVRVTLIEQDVPGASVAPQVFVCVKSVLFGPPMEILQMFSVTVPTFFSVEAMGALVVPTATVPKSSSAGDRLTMVP